MEKLPGLIIIYLAGINLTAFWMFGADKSRARRQCWRIPERRLWTAVLLGGSLGALVGMYGFRHKTKHKAFAVGIPLLFFVQIGMILAYCFYHECFLGINRNWIL